MRIKLLSLTVRIALLLILASATAWAVPTSALPDRWLPGDDVVSSAYNNQGAPVIAQGGDKLLIAWTDSRAIVAGGTESETGRDIYAMRVDASGNLLDETPIAITSAAASQVNPKVAWNGSNWLVVYEGNAPNGTGYYQNSLFAVRVSPLGQVLDAQPIPFYGLKSSGGSYWAVASDGNNWVIVVQGTSASDDIVALRVSPGGVVLDPPTRTIVNETYYMRSNIKLAYAGGSLMMTFNDQYLGGTYETRAVRFDSNLNLLGTPFQLLTMPISDLVGAGSQFYMVWHQQQPDFSTAVYGTRLDSNGQKLDDAGDNISGNDASGTFTNIAAAWDGMNWRVAWAKDITELRLARVSSVGSVLDPGGVLINGPTPGPLAGVGNGGVQIIWSPYVNSDQGVVTANISASNVAGVNRNVAIGAPRQIRTDIASSGNGFMAVYLSSTGSGHRVLAQPLDSSGNPTLPSPVELDAGDFGNGPGAPAVAWNGSLYMVAWGNSQGVVAQRLNANGSKIDAAPFVVIASAFGPPDIDAIDDVFFVAGRKYGSTPQFIDLYGARVNGSTGGLLDVTPIALASGYVSRAPAVTVLGGRWLVVYHSNWSHDASNADTGAIFVQTDGTKSAGFGLYNFSTAGGNGIFRIGLASNGSVALMVQSAEISSGVETDLLARLIYPDGTIAPVSNLTPWRGNQYNPQVAWDGTNFVIVYEEQKNRFADLDMLDGRSDLFGMRVSPAGSVIDPQGFVFSTSANAETLPTVAAQNGVSLIAGSLMLNDPPFANYRIGYNLFGSAGNLPPVAVAVATPGGGDIPLVVNFSSANSTDPDGNITFYAWDFGDGATSAAPNPSHTYTTPGPFVAHLTVTDNVGAQTMQAILVQAVAPNQPPVAVAEAAPNAGAAPLDVTFSADQSYDPDGAIGNFTWTYHDGTYSYGPTGYYTYNAPGIYVVTLTVYDGRNATGTDTVTINVGSTPPTATPTPTPPPTATPTPTPSPNPGVCTNNCLRSTDITLTSRAKNYSVTVTGKITVKSETGASVRNANVFVRWQGPDGNITNQNGNTNSQGIVSFSTSGGPGTYVLTVTNITKAGNNFDAANSMLSNSLDAKLRHLGAMLLNDGRIKLIWDTVDGATNYRVLRGMNNPYFDPSTAQLLATISHTGALSYDYTDSEISSNNAAADAFYLVEALDGGGAVLESTAYSGEKTSDLFPGF